MVQSGQQEAFRNEYQALASRKSIPPRSPVIKLNPMLDEDGCIRSNGRQQFAGYLPHDVRFPMIHITDKLWRKVQEIISQVWRRWLQEYLPLLSPRPKWTEAVKDLKKDDVVLVLDPKLPRGRWPLGRITETYPGREFRRENDLAVQVFRNSSVQP